MAAVKSMTGCIALAVLHCTSLSTAANPAAQAPLGPAITHYDFDVTVGKRSPDCFGKDIFNLLGKIGAKESGASFISENSTQSMGACL